MASRLIKEDRLPRTERLKHAGEFCTPYPKLRQPFFLCLTFPAFILEESRKHLSTTICTLGAQIDGDLRDRITTIHQNAQSLATQTRTLNDRTTALNKTTRQWSGIAESSRSRLKVGLPFLKIPAPTKLEQREEDMMLTQYKQEIGDIQNYAEMIEHQLSVIEETMRIVYDEESLMQESLETQLVV